MKKPTEVEAKALAKCFPFAKSKKEGFDPTGECVVANAQAKKKAAFKGKQRSVSVNVVMLKRYLPSIPKGNLRKELLSQGRIKSVSVTREMSNLQVRNTIIRAFKVASFAFLEGDRKGRLTGMDGNSLDGEGAVNRRGSLYLCETDVSVHVCVLFCTHSHAFAPSIQDEESTTEPSRKKPKTCVDGEAHFSKELVGVALNVII